MKKILFRADGDQVIGYGHIFRLIAMYDMLNEKFDCTFLCSESSYTQALENHNIPYISITKDVTELNYIRDNFDPAYHIVIVDGYQFDISYFSSLREFGFTTLYVDDLYQEKLPVDIILNHSPNADSSRYSESNASLALGVDFALLRNSFFSPRPPVMGNKVENVFVCFGGTDSHGLIEKVQIALNSMPEIKRVHIVGKQKAHSNDLNIEEQKFQFHSGLNDQEMIALMDECQLAIAPTSTISLELCYRSTPIIGGFFIDNQKDIYEGLLKLNCIIGLDNLTEVSAEQFENEIRRAISEGMLQVIRENQNRIFNGSAKNKIQKLLSTFV